MQDKTEIMLFFRKENVILVIHLFENDGLEYFFR